MNKIKIAFQAEGANYGERLEFEREFRLHEDLLLSSESTESDITEALFRAKKHAIDEIDITFVEDEETLEEQLTAMVERMAEPICLVKTGSEYEPTRWMGVSLERARSAIMGKDLVLVARPVESVAKLEELMQKPTPQAVW